MEWINSRCLIISEKYIPLQIKYVDLRLVNTQRSLAKYLNWCWTSPFPDEAIFLVRRDQSWVTLMIARTLFTPACTRCIGFNISHAGHPSRKLNRQWESVKVMAERFRPGDRGCRPNVLVPTFLQGRASGKKTDTTGSALKRNENRTNQNKK